MYILIAFSDQKNTFSNYNNDDSHSLIAVYHIYYHFVNSINVIFIWHRSPSELYVKKYYLDHPILLFHMTMMLFYASCKYIGYVNLAIEIGGILSRN